MEPVLPALIETVDNDFELMIAGVHLYSRGLRLPPGGVDTNEVLIHVRAIARSLQQHQGHTNNWMIVANDEVVGLAATSVRHPLMAPLISVTAFQRAGDNAVMPLPPLRQSLRAPKQIRESPR